MGIVLNHTWVMPDTDSPPDAAAAHRLDGFINRWFLDPLFKGGYPADMMALYGQDGPEVQEGDMETIAAPLDFLGTNYYTRAVVRHADLPPLNVERVSRDHELTEMGWGIYPEGLYRLLKRLHQEYQVPNIFITENGAAFHDDVSSDGSVDDPRRLDYIRQHLAAAHRAIQDGVPLRGYFVWSLLDNFEWAFGYSKRFGITRVDYDTLKRTIKTSGRWYAGVIRDHGFAG